MNDNFNPQIREKWVYGRNLFDLLEGMTSFIKEWNKDIFGNIFSHKKKIIVRLNDIQKIPLNCVDFI